MEVLNIILIAAIVIIIVLLVVFFILYYQSNQLVNNVNNQSLSNIEEIKKYKELLDMGAITEEEYNDKKKKLLN